MVQLLLYQQLYYILEGKKVVYYPKIYLNELYLPVKLD